MILSYNGSGTIKSQPGFDADKNKIIPKMILELHKMDIRTEFVENKIIFKRILRPYGYDKRRTIGPFWEGEIKMMQLEKDKIKLDWKVSFEYVLFTTFLFGVIAGCISPMFIDPKLRLISAVLVGTGIWLASFVAGRYWIIFYMEDFFESSCRVK